MTNQLNEIYNFGMLYLISSIQMPTIIIHCSASNDTVCPSNSLPHTFSYGIPLTAKNSKYFLWTPQPDWSIVTHRKSAFCSAGSYKHIATSSCVTSCTGRLKAYCRTADMYVHVHCPTVPSLVRWIHREGV